MMTLGYHDSAERSFYLNGFSQSPLPVQLPTSKEALLRMASNEVQQRTGIDPSQIPTSTEQLYKQIKGRVERELNKKAGQLKSQIENKLRKYGVQTLTDLGKQLAPQAAHELLRDLQGVLGSVKVPGFVQVELPSDLTAGAVLEAAGESVLQSSEALIKNKTGLDIELPRSLDPEELLRSVTGVLPSDAKEALIIGAQIGINYASSALAGVVAGATIGSSIPGLGTVIGIGMGLAFQALIAEKVPAFRKPCPPRSKCPLIEGQTISPKATVALPKSPIEQIPWVAQSLPRITSIYAAQRVRGGCTGGPDGVCISTMQQVAREAFQVSKATIPVLGLEQTEKYLALYKTALSYSPFSYVETRVGRKSVPWNIKQTKGEVGKRFIPELLSMLALRAVELRVLVRLAENVESLSASQRADLRWTLVTELRKATMQAQLDPSAAAQHWLTQVTRYITRMQAAEGVARQKRAAVQRTQQRRFTERKGDPGWQKKAVLTQLQFQCGQGSQAACAEYRRIAGGGLLTASQKAQFQNGKPTQAPRPPPRSAPKPLPRGRPDPKLYQRCYTLVAELVKKNPRAQRCLTRSDLDQLTKICMMAYGPSPKVTPQRALSLMAAYADNVCKRKGL